MVEFGTDFCTHFFLSTDKMMIIEDRNYNCIVSNVLLLYFNRGHIFLRISIECSI